MLQRSSISTTPKIAILPYALSIFPFLCVSELHGALSGHIFEETAERSLVFKSQNIGNLFGAFVAVKQETFSFRFHPFVDSPAPVSSSGNARRPSYSIGGQSQNRILFHG